MPMIAGYPDYPVVWVGVLPNRADVPIHSGFWYCIPKSWVTNSLIMDALKAEAERQGYRITEVRTVNPITWIWEQDKNT